MNSRLSLYPSGAIEEIQPILKNGWTKRNVSFYVTSQMSDKQTQSRAAMYSTLCYVKGDTTELCKSLLPLKGAAATFYKISYDIVLALGLTELKAYICWEENVSSCTSWINFALSYRH